MSSRSPSLMLGSLAPKLQINEVSCMQMSVDVLMRNPRHSEAKVLAYLEVPPTDIRRVIEARRKR
jgi:hypothetical protein